MTAVLNLMDDTDLMQRGINPNQLIQSYRNNRIGLVERCPVTDENMEEYALQLFAVALKLFELIDV